MSERFESWLKNLCKTFKTLTDPQKNTTVERIIDICGPEQRRLLSTKLEVLVKRDYLKCLPLELSFHVLKWLDPISLCRCCLVSKIWNKVILSCEDVWKNACRQLGMDTSEEFCEGTSYKFAGNSELTSSSWKQIYVSHVKNVKRLMREDAVEMKQLYGHTARVFALHCRGNYLATGSDDRSVRLWDLTTGQCKFVLKTHTCADIRFDENKVITASFDNTIGMWDWNSGESLQCFRGHTAAVFTVDYCDELDTLVSGSADTTLRIWKMLSGQCLQTRYGHTDWVIKVILRRAEVESQFIRKNQFVLLSMDKRAIKVWSLAYDCEKCLTTLSPKDSNIPLQPRLQFNGRTIACASETAVLLWDFKTFLMTREENELRRAVDLHFRIPGKGLVPVCGLSYHRIFTASPATWLVAYGHMYSLLMDANSLYVVKTRTEETMAKFSLPPFRRSVRGSNFTPGEVTWLDGLLTSSPAERFVFATSMPDYSVLLLMLKEST